MKGINYLSVVPMRKEPSDRSELVNQLLFGETFDILERQEKWSKIRLHHDKYEGWIDNKQYESNPGKVIRNKPAGVVTKLFTPHKSQILPMGSILQDPTSKIHSSKTSIIQTAKKFIDVPYLWGGRTFMGIDCSGFTQVVFRVNGKKLPRDSSQQQAQGKKIKLENAETNDLAFFDNAEGRVIHVGIILREKEKTRIIHASGKERIDSLDENGIFNTDTQTYSHHFHSIKRIA